MYIKQGYYYEFDNGNRFKVQYIDEQDLCYCRVVNKYDRFYMTKEDGDYKLFTGELKEIEPPDKDLTTGAQIRGGS